MSYGSFYGGRQGNSFILARSYPNIQSMTEAFNNINNLQVKYGEYVIINTENKSDPDNGKIFKRGYDGGAVYIATIVGPQGQSPFLTIGSYDSIPTEENQRRITSQGQLSLSDGLVPGKDENGNFNDTIEWKSYSVIEQNRDQGIVYLGFKIPYPVIDFEINPETTPYDQVAINKKENEINEGEHPFYTKWILNIPKGKHGNSIKNIKKIDLNYYFNSTISSKPVIYILTDSGQQILSQDMLKENDDDIITDGKIDATINDEILVYEYQNYEKNPKELKLYYIGPYKQISKVEYVEDTQNKKTYLNFHYSNGNAMQFENVISKVIKLSYDEGSDERGLLEIEYNTGESLSVPIKYIDKIDLKDNGILAYKTNVEQESVLEEPDDNHTIGIIRWIKNINYDPTDNNIIITYNTLDNESEQEKTKISVPFIADLNIEENGQVQIKYNGDNAEWENLEGRIVKWIDNISYNAENDTMSIYYNSDTEIDEETGEIRPSVIIENAFNKIKKVEFNENLSFYNEEIDDYESGPGFIITYSNNSTENIPFSTGKLIKNISIMPGGWDEESAEYLKTSLIITYTDDNSQRLEINGRLINNIVRVEDSSEDPSIPEDHFQINYDNGESQELDLIYPKTVIVDDANINSSHQIRFFDSQGDLMTASNPITGIEKMMINNNSLLVLYDNPTARENIPQERRVSITSINGMVFDWDNLGMVRTDSGLLVGKNVLPSEINNISSPTEQEIINYLNNEYEDGQIQGESLYRLITVGESYQNKKFYGFDFSAETWYLLGTIPQAASQVDCVCGTLSDFQSVNDRRKSALAPGGLYFIVEEE